MNAFFSTSVCSCARTYSNEILLLSRLQVQRNNASKSKRLVSQIFSGIYERPEAFCYIDTHLQLAIRYWHSISPCCKILLDQEQRSKLEIRWMRHIKCGCQSKTNTHMQRNPTEKATGTHLKMILDFANTFINGCIHTLLKNRASHLELRAMIKSLTGGVIFQNLLKEKSFITMPLQMHIWQNSLGFPFSPLFFSPSKYPARCKTVQELSPVV